MTPFTLIDASSRVMAGITWAAIALFVVAPLLRGDAATLSSSAPLLLTTAWIVYLVLWCPATVVAQDHTIIRNAFTTTTVGYDKISDIVVRRLATTVVRYTTDDGTERSVSVSAAPPPPRHRSRHGWQDFKDTHMRGPRATGDVDARSGTDLGPVSELYEAWLRGRSVPSGIESRRTMRSAHVVITCALAILLGATWIL